MRLVRNRKRQGRYNIIMAILLISIFCSCSLFALPERTISMDFQNVPLKDVLKIFSQQAGLNFVASENIENKQITVYFDSVTVNDALNSLMKANNITYDRAEGSNILIVRETSAAKVELKTKIYNLNFISLSKFGGGGEDSSDIETILTNLLTKSENGQALGSIVVDKRTNSIIVTSIPEDFVFLDETIEKLDAFTPQALIEAEIVEIQTAALKSMGLEWGATSTGTFLTFNGPVRNTKFPFVRARAPFSRDLFGGSTPSDEADIRLGTLSLSEFALVVKALETQGLAKYLAKPRIMALNNEEAEIKITTDSVVGIKSTSVTDTGEVIEEAERVETGVSLKVTPSINREGYITMTLEPQVSRAAQSALSTSFFDPATRSAKTTVMVKDGQSIAIGGLLTSNETDALRETPALSKIPLFGNLFRSNNAQSTVTELVIFITAHIVSNLEDFNEIQEKLEPENDDEAYLKELLDETALEETEDISEGGARIENNEIYEEPAIVKDSAVDPNIQRCKEIENTVIRLRKKRDVSK